MDAQSSHVVGGMSSERHPSAAPSSFLVDARLDPKPWGGRSLHAFGFPLPPGGTIGEAVITASEARVYGRGLEGARLGDLVATKPLAIVGRRGLEITGGRLLFPLLVKLIDAAEHLSIQVHPDDQAALSRDRLGKTEAWHVLAAEPGASLFLGLRPDVSLGEFAAACRLGNGAAAASLRRVPAIPGMTVLILAGTVHALGAGVLVYEVQQPSDVTYRLDDWGRLDGTGQPRELHLEEGLAVLDETLRPEPIVPIDLAPTRVRQLVTACRYFALERLALVTGEEIVLSAADGPQVITCLQGTANLTAAEAAFTLAAGQSAVVCPKPYGSCVRGLTDTMLLRTWVPDLGADIIKPARAVGAADDAIARLAGSLPDLRDALRRHLPSLSEEGQPQAAASAVLVADR